MSDAANRRSSMREMPGALRHTWYCSVSFCWNRMPGPPFRPTGLRAASPGPADGPSSALGQQRDELLVADVARCSQDDVLTLIGAAVVAGERAARDGRDDLGASDHRTAERMRAEDRLGRDVVDEVVRRVLDHRDLLEHDLALRVHVDERGPEDHVCHDVQSALEPIVRDACVDDGRLARRRRVQLSAELVEDLGDLLGRVARGALEQQVLDEVRDARARVGLVA